ncbi:MAG: hypothetical protein CSA75_00605 [Sorangium cellulosum]|nr:MAG: hypothetical protein CSA75_00605 [Sorangium cellulosum]
MFSPLRHLFWLAAFAITIGVIRPALAYAPFCDPRAATNLAPPPFTPIPDLQWETSTSPLFQEWCQQLQAARSGWNDNSPNHRNFSELNKHSMPDAGTPCRATMYPRRDRAQRLELSLERQHAPPGFHGRVYRPPR